MFNKSYRWSKIGDESNSLFTGKETQYKFFYTYKFKAEHTEYLVKIYAYGKNLFVIEFFLRKDKDSKKENKFGKLTHQHKASSIIFTCFDIMLSIMKENNLASFAFVGSSTVKDEILLEKECTKRFRIYRYASINLLGDKSFEQFGDEKTNCYLIANKLANTDEIRVLANVILKSYL